MEITLSLTGRHHAELKRHLYPGDGNEAVALALCGRRHGSTQHRLLVRKIATVPHGSCRVRRPDRVTWPTTEILPSLLDEAEAQSLAVLKIHSHPGGFAAFSGRDDATDRELYPSIYTWVDDAGPHASAVMLPNGQMFGRAVGADGQFEPLRVIKVVGDDLEFWHAGGARAAVPKFGERFAQAFGAGTFGKLRQLTVAVVGCSGTGCLVVEQLARNGIGALVLVDPDFVGPENLNRLVHATSADAERRIPKVELLARAIAAMGLGTKVQCHAESLWNLQVVEAVADCDLVIGCMDSVDGRHLLNRLATFYLLPYLDLGVKLVADGAGGVDQVCGAVHYLQPGGSSLLSRSVYTLEEVRAAGLRRTDPATYAEHRRARYIVGVQEDRPAVISVNMATASLAVNELLARLHPYRLEPNAAYAVQRFSLSHDIHDHEPDGEPCQLLAPHVGRGDVVPLLGLPALGDVEEAA